MLASLNTKVEIWLLLGFLLWGTAIGQNARQKPQVPRAARDKELQALIDMATDRGTRVRGGCSDSALRV